MALLFADNSADSVGHGSGASLDFLTAATVLMWIYPTTVANALRQIIGKKGGANTGWVIFKRGTDGTSWAVQVDRVTADGTVDLPGMQANVWQYIGFSWNTTTNAFASYRGTLTAVVADVTALAVPGSGVQVDDSAENLSVGSGNQSASGMSVAMVQVYNRVLTLAEIRQQQFRPFPKSGCVLFSHYGFQGTGTQRDYSGAGNVGTVTTATVSAGVPIVPFPYGMDLVSPPVRGIAPPPVGVVVTATHDIQG